jgi:hypothetical protein
MVCVVEVQAHPPAMKQEKRLNRLVAADAHVDRVLKISSIKLFGGF